MSAPWWKKTTTYQIYPRSFCDSNGDGIGDLQGVIGKLDYLESLGVETLWLSPFFASPQADFGYDISDHFAIAKEYGTMDDVRELIRNVHSRGMKIVFDMVLNHTSREHPWFIASRSSRSNPKRDYYIWRRGRKPGRKSPPNNWRSMLGGSGWQYDEPTDEWYFASFLSFQPDLNYRNPEIRKLMLDVVRYWLAEGVDGLRFDIFNALFKDESFADNPFSWRPIPSDSNPDGYFQHPINTIDHPDTIAFAREVRAMTDGLPAPERFLVGEVFGSAEQLKRYCGKAADGLHLVFLFEALSTPLSGRAIRELVSGFERAFPEPFLPTYVFGNHDRPRSSHRARGNLAKSKLLATLQLTARGVPFIYYGEEIGMLNAEIPLRDGLDPIAARFRFLPHFLVAWLRQRGALVNRDECRTPMQWNESPNAGFCPRDVAPWLPVGPDAAIRNVAHEEGDPESLLHCYKNLLAIRRHEPALQEGALEWITSNDLDDDVVAYRRVLGDRTVDVFLNFAARSIPIAIDEFASRVVFSNVRGERHPASKTYLLKAFEAIVVLTRDIAPTGS